MRCTPPTSSRPDSEVYNYLLPRLAAANQDIAIGWGLKRFGPVAYRAGDQSTFARVADTRPARPSHGSIAGFRQLEQALVFRVPRDSKTTARKGDARSRAGRSGGLMGRSRGRSSHPGRYRLAGPKDLRMHSICTYAPSRKTGGQVTQKRGRAAQVEK